MADYVDPVLPPIISKRFLLDPVNQHPEGWGYLVLDTDDDGAPFVVCGWTDDQEFHQYAPTEQIVAVLFRALVPEAEDVGT